MSTTITRKFEFDSAHRVLGHESKCRFLHGHRYVAKLTVSSETGLDNLGRVIDFSVLKTWVGSWIDANWDHNILLHEDDPLLYAAKDHEKVFDGREPYVMSGKRNPTAENIAKDLCIASQVLFPHLTIVHADVWETPNCSACYFALYNHGFLEEVKKVMGKSFSKEVKKVMGKKDA